MNSSSCHLHGHPQWRRKRITVGLPSLRGILSDIGALEPTFGAGETSFLSGVFQDANSFQKSDLGSSAAAAMFNVSVFGVVLW
jgi:hypothetical protein